MSDSRRTVAVIGANGFIGSRVVEKFHLEGFADVRPVVRRASALASAGRFRLDGRVADALDETRLGAALAGADAVLHTVAGDTKTIEASIDSVYRAATAAGCRRLVYLSSAAVHGQAPAAGTNEDSALSDRQPIEYNNAKVRAENRLFELRRRGRLEVVVLRPGIVFGPRSAWIAGLADAVLAGSAYLISDGAGICNSIYVDNLVQAIGLAIEVPHADGRSYLVGDDEAPTWREFYRPVVEALGFCVEGLPSFDYHEEQGGIAERIDRVRRSEPVQVIVRSLPEPLRLGLTAFYAAMSRKAGQAESAQATPTLEMALLQRCSYRLPWARARTELGYAPRVGFVEAFRRTIGWLSFAGYPVVTRQSVGNCDGE